MGTHVISDRVIVKVICSYHFLYLNLICFKMTVEIVCVWFCNIFES